MQLLDHTANIPRLVAQGVEEPGGACFGGAQAEDKCFLFVHIFLIWSVWLFVADFVAALVAG